MIIDLHNHTKYSYDAENASVRAHVRSAVEKGVDILGFSEHVDLFRRYDLKESDFAPGLVNFESYEREVAPYRIGRAIIPDLTAEQADIAACREKFGGKITLRAGVELGEPYAAPDIARRLMEDFSFDYVIGAVHHMSNDMDMYFYRYEQIHPDDVWAEYFGEMQKLLDFGHIDILAHIDYPLRIMKLPHNRPTLRGYMDYVDAVLRQIISRGIALESNTKGLFGWQREVGPEDFILSRYRELGGELITIGSDSHAPETVARGTKRAWERIRAAGFRYVTDFQNRTILQHAL